VEKTCSSSNFAELLERVETLVSAARLIE